MVNALFAGNINYSRDVTNLNVLHTHTRTHEHEHERNKQNAHIEHKIMTEDPLYIVKQNECTCTCKTVDRNQMERLRIANEQNHFTYVWVATRKRVLYYNTHENILYIDIHKGIRWYRHNHTHTYKYQNELSVFHRFILSVRIFRSSLYSVHCTTQSVYRLYY